MTGVIAVLRRVNLRHLSRRRLRLVLTFVGIAVGVALVVSTRLTNAAVVNSVESTLEGLGGIADLEVAATSPTGISEDLAASVANSEGVAQAAPVVQITTSARTEAGTARLLVVGSTPAFADLASDAAETPLRLRGGYGAGGGGLVLSDTAASVLNASLGDEVEVTTPKGPTLIPVTGLLSSNDLAAVNGGRIGLMDLPAAQAVFAREGLVDTVYIRVAEGASVSAVIASLEARWGDFVFVAPPGERASLLTQPFQVVATLISLAGLVALMVALLVVYNTTAMSIADRRHELALSLALGARRRELLTAFVIESAALGAAAAAVGTGVGIGMARLLVGSTASIASPLLPVSPGDALRLDPSEIALGLLAGTGIAVLGALLAARRVLRVSPIEALGPQASPMPTASLSIAGRGTTAASAGFLGVAVVLGVVAVFVSREHPWLVQAWLVAWLAGFALLIPWAVPRVMASTRGLIRRIFGPVGRLASDALALDPGRTSVTVAAFVLTLGMVVALGTAMRSFETDYNTKLRRDVAAPLYVVPSDDETVFPSQPLDASLTSTLEDVEGVRFVDAWNDLYFTLGGHVVFGFTGRFLDADEADVPEAVGRLGQGSTSTEPRSRGSIDELVAGDRVIVSRLLARDLEVNAGETLVLPTPTGPQEFEVSAVVDGQNWSTDSTLLLDRRTYLRHWNDPTADRLPVFLESGAEPTDVQRALEESVRRSGYGAEVITGEELRNRFSQPFDALFSMTNGLLLIGLALAGITIANTTFASVLERRWTLGLQRALGVTSRQVRRALLVEVSIIGALGCLGAVLMGLVTAMGMVWATNILFALSQPYTIPVDLLVFALSGAVVVAGAATVVPRRMALRVPIIRALRYQ